jgi:tetratricopeptide (TPR) repeat protein
MKIHLVVLNFLILFCSCSQSGIKIIEQKSDELYQQKLYSDAKDCYDKLITIDSTKGEYYFKRGYCKSMISSDDPTIISDYLQAIKHNYKDKKSAYLNIAAEHYFRVLFRCSTDKEQKTECDSALHFYSECLRVDPGNAKALQDYQRVALIRNMVTNKGSEKDIRESIQKLNN